MISHASFSFSASLYSFFFPFMTSAALSWPLMLLSVSLLLSTVSSSVSWPLLLSHGLSCFFKFLCFSLQFLLSFHGLCCSLMTFHVFYSFSASLYSFFLLFMASAALSWPLVLLSVSLLLSTVSSFFSWPLLRSHDLSCYFQFLCFSLQFFFPFMTSALSWPLMLFQFLCFSLQFLLFFHGLCCCFTAFAVLLLFLMLLSWPLWLLSRPQLLSADLCCSISRVCCCFTAFVTLLLTFLTESVVINDFYHNTGPGNSSRCFEKVLSSC